jgi:hypothetical protein
VKQSARTGRRVDHRGTSMIEQCHRNALPRRAQCFDFERVMDAVNAMVGIDLIYRSC